MPGVRGGLRWWRRPGSSTSTNGSDDKFIACAIAGACDVIVSGDAHLLRVSGLAGMDVVSPRAFVENYLAN